jgi:hypothetical protein
MQQPKIFATFNIFEEAEFIEQAIQSVLWCDKVIVVDGAFPGFPSDHSSSQDGTLEIVEELQNQNPGKITLITFDKYVETTEKMDAYMQHISTGDYFLRLNGDEIVECEYPETLYDDLQQQIQCTGNLPLYQITEYPDGLYKKYYYQPKLLRKSPTLKLTSRHVAFTNNFTPPYEVTGPRGAVAPVEANLLPILIKIRHMKEHRCIKRQNQNQKWLNHYVNNQQKRGLI